MYGEHIGMLAFIKSPFMYLHLLDPSLAGLFSFLAEKSVANNLGFRCTQRKQRRNKNEIRGKGKEKLPLSQCLSHKNCPIKEARI